MGSNLYRQRSWLMHLPKRWVRFAQIHGKNPLKFDRLTLGSKRKVSQMSQSLRKLGDSTEKQSHRIPWDWYICLHLPYLNHKNQPKNVGKYTSPMEHLGINTFFFQFKAWAGKPTPLKFVLPAMEAAISMQVQWRFGFSLVQESTTWRIIPVNKWLVTPIYKPFRPFGRGTTLLKLTWNLKMMVSNRNLLELPGVHFQVPC